MTLLHDGSLNPLAAASVIKVMRATAQKHAVFLLQFLEALVQEKDWERLYVLRLLIPAHDGVRLAMSPDTPTLGDLAQSLTSKSIFQIDEGIRANLMELLHERVYQAFTPRNVTDSELHSDSRPTLTQILMRADVESMEGIMMARGMGVCTPGTISQWLRMNKKALDRKVHITVCEEAGVYSGLPWRAAVFGSAAEKVSKAWMIGDNIRTLKKENRMNVVTILNMSSADEATLRSIRDIKDLVCGEGVEAVNLEDLASRLRSSKRSIICQVPENPEELELYLNPKAGVGILDCVLEHETTGTVPRKQSELTDYGFVQGVQTMMRCMESAPQGPGEARLHRRLRYLGSFKRVGPKKDLYAITKAASSGMRSIVTSSATVNNGIRNFLQGLNDACHCEPMATSVDAYAWSVLSRRRAVVVAPRCVPHASAWGSVFERWPGLVVYKKLARAQARNLQTRA